MYRKCLIAIGTVVLCMSTLYAHPNWGVTVMDGQYEWAKKTNTVQVLIRVEKWAKISLAEGEDGIMFLSPEYSGSSIYSGCVSLDVLNNFKDFRILAELTPHMGADSWSISLSSPYSTINSTPVLEPNPNGWKVALMVENINMNSASPAPVKVCVTADTPYLNELPQNNGPVATVTFTMYIAYTMSHPFGPAPPIIQAYLDSPE